jgi:hypothetical protein
MTSLMSACSAQDGDARRAGSSQSVSIAKPTGRLGQVVKVLAVAIPLQPLVERHAQSALGQRLTDAQSAARRVIFGVPPVEAAQPTMAVVVGAMPSQDVMHLIDEPQRQFPVSGLTGDASETEKVADGESIGPEIAPRRSLPAHAGALRETQHDCRRFFDGFRSIYSSQDACPPAVSSPARRAETTRSSRTR